MIQKLSTAPGASTRCAALTLEVTKNTLPINAILIIGSSYSLILWVKRIHMVRLVKCPWIYNHFPWAAPPSSNLALPAAVLAFRKVERHRRLGIPGWPLFCCSTKDPYCPFKLQTDLFARLVLRCIKGNHLLIIIVASTKVCKKLISKPANHGIEIVLQCSLTHLPSF